MFTRKTKKLAKELFILIYSHLIFYHQNPIRINYLLHWHHTHAQADISLLTRLVQETMGLIILTWLDYFQSSFALINCRQESPHLQSSTDARCAFKGKQPQGEPPDKQTQDSPTLEGWKSCKRATLKLKIKYLHQIVSLPVEAWLGLKVIKLWVYFQLLSNSKCHSKAAGVDRRECAHALWG